MGFSSVESKVGGWDSGRGVLLSGLFILHDCGDWGWIFVCAIENRHIRWHVIPPLESNHGECWHRPQGWWEGFSPAAAKRHAGRCRMVTRLSCSSLHYSRNISPPPLSVFDFPLRGRLRAEIQQAQRGHRRAALCKHGARRCAWKWTKKVVMLMQLERRLCQTSFPWEVLAAALREFY